MLVSDLAQALEKAGRRNDDTALALDRLDHDGGDVGVHRLGDSVGVTIGKDAEARSEWAESET